MKTTVIHHSADYDGLFCREIARKFLPDAELIGWDYGDPVPDIGIAAMKSVPEVHLYMLDISIPELMSYPGLIWIDHHKSAIEKYGCTGLHDRISGYRIDGVAACRLAWQWFASNDKYDEACQTGVYPVRDRRLPAKEGYLQRQVNEPMAVRLAGEYDIWDHRGDGDVEFQFGLDSQTSVPWASILRVNSDADELTKAIVTSGTMAMQCYKKRDSEIMLSRSFTTEFEGLNFLCLNTARCNSNSFLARDNPNTGHDALLAFYWTGKAWSVSLYHANHRKDIDLSLIAVKHGGGGHKGACGFRAEKLPFLK